MQAPHVFTSLNMIIVISIAYASDRAMELHQKKKHLVTCENNVGEIKETRNLGGKHSGGEVLNNCHLQKNG